MRQPRTLSAVFAAALCLGTVAPRPAIAEEPPKAQADALGLESALELALAASPEYRAAAAAASAARRSVDHSWNLFLPAVKPSAEGGLEGYLFAPSTRTESALAPSASLRIGASLSLDTNVLFDLEKRRLDVASAELAVLEAEARVRRDTAKAYFYLVSLGLELDNKAKAAELAAERSRIAALRFERGLGSELDALRAAMTERTAAATRDKAAGELAKRSAAFAHALGLPPGTPLFLSAPLPEPSRLALSPSESSIEELAERRLDLRKDRLAQEAASLARRRYEAVNRLPLVSVGAAWNALAATPGSASPMSASDSWSASATVSFNADAWIPGSRRELEQRGLEEAEARLAEAYERAGRSALAEVASLRLDAELARSAVGVAEAQVALAERIEARTAEAYERGAATALELEDARLSLDGARQALVAARYQCLAAAIDLGYAMGRSSQ